jgi:hypothetical protein
MKQKTVGVLILNVERGCCTHMFVWSGRIVKRIWRMQGGDIRTENNT